MSKYKFKYIGSLIHLRGRDPIDPTALPDEEIDKLLEAVPSLKDQFFITEEPETEEE